MHVNVLVQLFIVANFKDLFCTFTMDLFQFVW